MAIVSLDTNVLIYAADPSTGVKHENARAILAGLAEADAVLTQQVLGEFLNVGRRQAHLNQRRIRRIAVRLSGAFPVLTTPRELLFEAFDRAARFQLQFWDSVIVTVCIGHAVSCLISEDMQDGMVIDGLKVVNPFNPANAALLRELLASPA